MDTPSSSAGDSRSSMPVGISANSLGLNDDRGFDGRAFAKLLIVMGVVAALAFGIWAVISFVRPLSLQSLTNEGYTYKLQFFKDAAPAYLEGSAALKSSQGVIVTARPVDDDYLTECTRLGSRWNQAFYATINGVERPVCSLNNQRFYTNFNRGNRHALELRFGAPNKGSLKLIQQIFNSVTVQN